MFSITRWRRVSVAGHHNDNRERQRNVNELNQDNISQAVQGDVILYDDGLRGLVGADGRARTKLGWDAMRKLARQLCALVSTFAQYLKDNLPPDSIVPALLDVTELLCKWMQSVAEPIDKGAPFDHADNRGVEFADALRRLSEDVDRRFGVVR